MSKKYIRYNKEYLSSLSNFKLQEIFEYIVYKGFRTGENFKTVRHLLGIEQKVLYEKGIYKFITRHTVLGKLREMKLKLFELEIGQNEYSKDEKINMIISSRWWVKNKYEPVGGKGGLPI